MTTGGNYYVNAACLTKFFVTMNNLCDIILTLQAVLVLDGLHQTYDKLLLLFTKKTNA
jgi:hypothetical protein